MQLEKRHWDEKVVAFWSIKMTMQYQMAKDGRLRKNRKTWKGEETRRFIIQPPITGKLRLAEAF